MLLEVRAWSCHQLRPEYIFPLCTLCFHLFPPEIFFSLFVAGFFFPAESAFSSQWPALSASLHQKTQTCLQHTSLRNANRVAATVTSLQKLELTLKLFSAPAGQWRISRRWTRGHFLFLHPNRQVKVGAVWPFTGCHIRHKFLGDRDTCSHWMNY